MKTKQDFIDEERAKLPPPPREGANWLFFDAHIKEDARAVMRGEKRWEEYNEANN